MNTSTTRTQRLLVVGAVGAIAGAAVNTLIYGVGRAADLDYIATRSRTGAQHIQLGHVVSFSLMSFAVGLAVAVIATLLRRPSLRVLQIVGAAVAVVSVSMDFSIDSAVAAKATLALMHLVVGIAYVASLRVARSSRTLPATGAPARNLGQEPALTTVAI